MQDPAACDDAGCYRVRNLGRAPSGLAPDERMQAWNLMRQLDVEDVSLLSQIASYCLYVLMMGSASDEEGVGSSGLHRGRAHLAICAISAASGPPQIRAGLVRHDSC